MTTNEARGSQPLEDDLMVWKGYVPDGHNREMYTLQCCVDGCANSPVVYTKEWDHVWVYCKDHAPCACEMCRKG